MVKLKRFFYFAFVFIFVGFSLPIFVSCSGNEINRISKGLSSYSIEATLFDDMTISASEKVDYVNRTGNDAEYVYFNLYPRAFREDAIFKPYTSLTLATCFPRGISYGDMEILKVYSDKGNLEFELIGEDENILKVKLESAIKKNKTVSFCIDFRLIIPNCTHRFGYYNGNINLGNWYPVICPYVKNQYFGTPYYSTGDPFCTDVANYNITMHYPEKYKMFSTGNSSISVKNETATASVIAKAVRDFAVCFSDNCNFSVSKSGKTNVVYCGYSGDEDLSEYLSISTRAMDYFSKTFGNYPYENMVVMKTPFIYGGMEYPGIVFISDSIDNKEEFKKVIVHEIAHQWWYGVVGNDEVNEAWLDESLAEYSTALFFENNGDLGINYDELINNAISSYSLYVDVISTIRGEVNTKMNLAINEYQNDYEYSYMVYVKGVIMFDELKKVVGEKKLVSGFKKYYNDNKFSIASKDDFYKAFESACHKDLYNFFEGYIGGTTIISDIN